MPLSNVARECQLLPPGLWGGRAVIMCLPSRPPTRAAQAADQGIGGQAWDYRDMRSQQLLSRLIERMRALPQPVVCAVQARRARGRGQAVGWRGAGCGRIHATDAASQAPADCTTADTLIAPAPFAGPQGAAAGAGFALAMASDVRIASRDAKFSAAFVRLGLTGGWAQGVAGRKSSTAVLPA